MKIELMTAPTCGNNAGSEVGKKCLQLFNLGHVVAKVCTTYLCSTYNLVQIRTNIMVQDMQTATAQ